MEKLPEQGKEKARNSRQALVADWEYIDQGDRVFVTIPSSAKW